MNKLKHNDIYPGMKFKNNYGVERRVVDVSPNNGGCSFLLVRNKEQRGVDGPCNAWWNIEELNKMQFLGVQTEPVQLGVVEGVMDKGARFPCGEKYLYFGDANDDQYILRDSNGCTFTTGRYGLKLTNAPTPEHQKEITKDGEQYLLKKHVESKYVLKESEE